MTFEEAVAKYKALFNRSTRAGSSSATEEQERHEEAHVPRYNYITQAEFDAAVKNVALAALQADRDAAFAAKDEHYYAIVEWDDNDGYAAIKAAFGEQG